MKSLRRFFTRLFNSAAMHEQEERLREEIAGHIALQTEENLRAGFSPVEARRRAMLKFGGVESMKQDYRAERGLLFVEHQLGDLRNAVRSIYYLGKRVKGCLIVSPGAFAGFRLADHRNAKNKSAMLNPYSQCV